MKSSFFSFVNRETFVLRRHTALRFDIVARTLQHLVKWKSPTHRERTADLSKHRLRTKASAGTHCNKIFIPLSVEDWALI
jgi:hypothetical protein